MKLSKKIAAIAIFSFLTFGVSEAFAATEPVAAPAQKTEKVEKTIKTAKSTQATATKSEGATAQRPWAARNGIKNRPTAEERAARRESQGYKSFKERMAARKALKEKEQAETENTQKQPQAKSAKK